MRVGIVDSGVNCEAVKNMIEQRTFTNWDGSSVGDINGHGTMAAKMIEDFSEREIEIISARIFDQTLATNIKTLISALEFLDTCDLNVIHMSISVSTVTIHDQLRKICNKILKKGIKIVTSYSNKSNATALEQVDGVIAVQGEFFRNSCCYWYNDMSMQAVADKSPMLVQCGDKWYRFYDGNSKAAALFTSHLIKCYDDSKQAFDMELLKCRAEKNIWEAHSTFPLEVHGKNSVGTNEKFYGNVDVIDRVLVEAFEVQDKAVLYAQDWLSPPLAVNGTKAARIIYLLEKEYHSKFDMKHVYLEDFYNHKMFEQFVKRNLG